LAGECVRRSEAATPRPELLESGVAVDAGVFRRGAAALAPVSRWLDASPAAESAWATPVAAASDAQKPTATAPVPSQREMLVCGCRVVRRRRVLVLVRRVARCRAATFAPNE